MIKEAKKFYDKNGVEIKAGDILYREFYSRRRERPCQKRVAYDMMGNEVIVSDEGELLSPEKQWIKHKVGWSGACMVMSRYDTSNFQGIMGSELFDEHGENIHETSAFTYFNSTFDSTVYEVIND